MSALSQTRNTEHTYWLAWRHLVTSFPVCGCRDLEKIAQPWYAEKVWARTRPSWSFLPRAGDVKVPLAAPPRDAQHHVEPLSITPSTPSAPLNPSIALEHIHTSWPTTPPSPLLPSRAPHVP
ncbi:hypothetical protein IG631_20314 [Alternaria alternata]|nr:hypothetical protein IG631_20314 [Alternaria alternata]